MINSHVKEHFNLSYQSERNVFNIFPYSDSTLSAFKIDQSETDYLITISKAYERTKRSDITEIIKDRFDKVTFVKIDDYPLPAFILKTGEPIINLSVLDVKQLTDYSAPDILSLIIYSQSLSVFSTSKLLKVSLEDLISVFYLSVFMKLFGKKSGLIGSYKNLIPKLMYIISIYVHEGIFKEKTDAQFKKMLNTRLKINSDKELDLKYDFENISEFLKCINDNRIVSISDNTFSTSVINIAGVVSLPMFEDASRLFASILSSRVSGNHVFSSYWIKASKEIYEKMTKRGTDLFKKGL